MTCLRLSGVVLCLSLLSLAHALEWEVQYDNKDFISFERGRVTTCFNRGESIEIGLCPFCISVLPEDAYLLNHAVVLTKTDWEERNDTMGLRKERADIFPSILHGLLAAPKRSARVRVLFPSVCIARVDITSRSNRLSVVGMGRIPDGTSPPCKNNTQMASAIGDHGALFISESREYGDKIILLRTWRDKMYYDLDIACPTNDHITLSSNHSSNEVMLLDAGCTIDVNISVIIERCVPALRAPLVNRHPFLTITWAEGLSSGLSSAGLYRPTLRAVTVTVKSRCRFDEGGSIGWRTAWR